MEASLLFYRYDVKGQFIQLATALASQLLLVDEVMRAGKNMGKSSIPSE